MKKSSSLFNNSGTTSIFTLALIGLCIVSTFFCFKIFHLLDTEKATSHICRQELLKTQTAVAKDLQGLLDLNRIVQGLRISKRTAQAMMAAGAATLNPALVAAGERLYMVTVKSQRTVELLQKYYIQSGNLKMFGGLNSTSRLIEKELRIRQNRLRTGSQKGITSDLQFNSILLKPTKLAVRKIASDDGPPEYELENDFIHKQALHVSWMYQHEIGRGSQTIWKQINLKKTQSCSVSLESLEQEGHRFQSILIAAKPLSRPYPFVP